MIYSSTSVNFPLYRTDQRTHRVLSRIIPNLFVSSDLSSRDDILSIDLSRRIYRPSQLLYNPK